MTQRGTYDPRLPVIAWVYAIARHKLVDLLYRRGRREALHESLDDLDESLHPAAPEVSCTRSSASAASRISSRACRIS